MLGMMQHLHIVGLRQLIRPSAILEANEPLAVLPLDGDSAARERGEGVLLKTKLPEFRHADTQFLTAAVPFQPGDKKCFLLARSNVPLSIHRTREKLSVVDPSEYM